MPHRHGVAERMQQNPREYLVATKQNDGEKQEWRLARQLSEPVREYARLVLANPRVAAWNPDEYPEPLSPAEEKELRAVHRIVLSALRNIATTARLPRHRRPR